MKFVRLILVIVCCGLLIGPNISVQAETTPIPEDQHVQPLQPASQEDLTELEEAALRGGGSFGYTWIVGSAFTHRNSAITDQYGASGCVYATNPSLSGDQANFLADVALPQGTVIRGVRFFYRDFDTNSSRLLLHRFDAQGGFEPLVSVTSSGDTGFGSTYVAATNPVTVENGLTNLALVWTPDGNTNTQQLCGARVYYQLPEQPVSGMQYLFASGQLFTPRTSSYTYSYGGRGCLTGNNGSWTFDVNLPSGSTLDEITLFTNDTLTGTIGLFLTSYDGLGNFTDHETFVSQNVDGYSQVTQAVDPAYIVNQHAEALVVTITLPSGQVADFCGVRLRYTPNAQPVVAQERGFIQFPPRLHYSRSVAGSTFHLRSSGGSFTYPAGDGRGCIASTSSGNVFVTDLQLPQNARMEWLDFFYQDTVNTANASLSITQFTSSNTVNQIVDSVSIDNTQVRFTQVSPTFTVDHFDGGLILDWRPFHDTSDMQLCRARILYSLPAEFVMLPTVMR